MGHSIAAISWGSDELLWFSDYSVDFFFLIYSFLADCCYNQADASVQQENSICSCKINLFFLQNLFLFLLYMQTMTYCRYLSASASSFFFCLVQLLVFHVLQKISWTYYLFFLSVINISLSCRNMQQDMSVTMFLLLLLLWMLVFLQLGSESRSTY